MHEPGVRGGSPGSLGTATQQQDAAHDHDEREGEPRVDAPTAVRASPVEEHEGSDDPEKDPGHGAGRVGANAHAPDPALHDRGVAALDGNE